MPETRCPCRTPSRSTMHFYSIVPWIPPQTTSATRRQSWYIHVHVSDVAQVNQRMLLQMHCTLVNCVFYWVKPAKRTLVTTFIPGAVSGDTRLVCCG
jgi:hypothetical protein